MRRVFIFISIVFALAPGVLAQPGTGPLEKVDYLVLHSKFSEALKLLEDLSGETPSIITENKKAEILTRLGNFGAAHQILADIHAELSTHPDAFLQAITDSNRGFLELNEGRADRAEEWLRQALRQFESADKDDTPDAAQAFSYLGLVYMSQGKYTEAQEQLHRALSLREKLVGNKDAFLAATYNDLGLAYSQTDKDAALDFYQQAENLYKTLYGDQDAKVAMLNINIGILNRDLRLFDDALANFEIAQKIWNGLYSLPHPAKAIVLYNLGQIHAQLHDQKTAAEFYEKSLQIYRDCYGSKHPEIASVLNSIGNLHLAQSRFDQALQSYQQALQANVQDFDDSNVTANPALTNYYNGSRLLHTLLFKAEAFESRYTRKSLKFSDLSQALDALTLCDSLIDQLRHHSTNENDKMLVGVMATDVYADGVRVAYLAALNALKKEPYYEKAFYFAEKSKSAVLQESISESNAKSFAGIPVELLEDETNLKSALALTAQKLAEKPSAEEEKSLRQTSFELKRKYDSFIEKLERDYPGYFNLKFNTATPSVRDIQSLLDDQTALISYFIDEKNNQLYIFVLRKEHYKVWQRSMPADFDKYITGLRNGLYFQEINTYKLSAYMVGRTILPPLPASITELVILPAGRLGVVPFETLLMRDPEGVTMFQNLPYLVTRCGIRYEFSAGLLLQKAIQPPSNTRASIFLCAPVNFPERPYLGELPGTETEVTEISKLFAAKNLTSAAFTHRQANENLIKTETLKDFCFLHFATHGVVDESRPELSRIFLRSGAEDDGDLFAGEIYNLELKANLVTLSACQTGLGKIVKGEGVIGLSRALTYAGANKIMVSYWNVADQSTAILMKDFYELLLQDPNSSYSHSLRQAKLRLMKDERFAAPFYWAPFVLIGF